jgi:hypothetical protein
MALFLNNQSFNSFFHKQKNLFASSAVLNSTNDLNPLNPLNKPQSTLSKSIEIHEYPLDKSDLLQVDINDPDFGSLYASCHIVDGLDYIIYEPSTTQSRYVISETLSNSATHEVQIKIVDVFDIICTKYTPSYTKCEIIPTLWPNKPIVDLMPHILEIDRHFMMVFTIILLCVSLLMLFSHFVFFRFLSYKT